MRLDSEGLARLQHELTAARRRQEGLLRKLDGKIASVPKRMGRLEEAVFDAGERLIPAFRDATGVERILGNPGIMKAFDLRRVSKSQRPRLVHLADAVKAGEMRLPHGAHPSRADMDVRVVDLLTFAVTRGALRVDPSPGLEVAANAVEDITRRIRELREEEKRARFYRETCAGILHDLEEGSEVVNRCLLAVRRHEALVLRKAELAGEGGKRRAVARVDEEWASRLETKRAEIGAIETKLRDIRWQTLSDKEALRAFFSGHPGLVPLMVSILRNIAVLLGGLVKSGINEVSPFELRVAMKEHGRALAALGEDDPLRRAGEQERMAAFEALLGADEAVGAFNAIRRNTAEETRLKRVVADAKRELAALERRASVDAAAAARAAGDERAACAKECSKAREEAKACRATVRDYYHRLRGKHGLPRGMAGFPEGHAAMLADLISEDKLDLRTMRRRLPEIPEQKETIRRMRAS